MNDLLDKEKLCLKYLQDQKFNELKSTLIHHCKKYNIISRFYMNDWDLGFYVIGDNGKISDNPLRCCHFIEYVKFLLDNGLLGRKWNDIIYDPVNNLFIES